MRPSLRRLVASAAGTGRGTPPWPHSRNPSPYEIFGMTPGSFDKKRLAETYIQLAKLYHPDRLSKEWDKATCTDRFKRVVEAHSILKDDVQRERWNLRNNRAGFSSMQYTTSRASRANYGPTEEEYNMWSNQQEKAFREGLQANRIWLLKCVVTSVAIVAAIELYLLTQAADSRIQKYDEVSRQVAVQHLIALDNYDKGDGMRERIDRFLAHRQRLLDERPSYSYSSLTGTNKPRPKGTLYGYKPPRDDTEKQLSSSDITEESPFEPDFEPQQQSEHSH